MATKTPEQRFNVDQRVRLMPDEAEGWGEEFGTIEEYEGVGLYLVRVDDKYRVDAADDGLREVNDDNLEPV